MSRKSTLTVLSFVLFLLVLASANLAAAQSFQLEGDRVVAVPGRHPGYGIANLAVVSVPDRGFTPLLSSTTYSWSGGRYMTNGGEMYAPVQLPDGALVEIVEMEACDDTDVGDVTLLFTYCPSPGSGTCFATVALSTGVPETPGCNVFSTPLTFPVVNNAENSYAFVFFNTTTDSSTRWKNARVYYRLQISPAPVSATFSDVPVGHPLHQFIEALASSGITAGCGGGNFCPNDPVTRGQMAVFLAKALGLHWAP